MSKNSLLRLNPRLSVLAATLAIAGMPLAADAAGLGRITVLSALGQPLRAEIELTASRDEMQGMVARVAAPDAFKLAGLDYANTLSALRFAIETRGTQSYVVLTSDRPIRDPFVDMLIELNWSAGRMVREYTFLLDPPEMMAKAPAAAAPRPVKPAQPAAVAEPARPATPAATGPVAATTATPAAAPAKREQGDKPAASQTVAVKRGDTLHAIASTVRPDGVSLEQMLVGLYRANPDAFDGDNMNRLRAGKILTVPEATEVAGIEPAAARREVHVQVADWNAYKRKLAGAAGQMAAPEAGAGQRAEGKITAKLETPAAPGSDSRDQVKVSKTQREAASTPAAGEEQKVVETRAVAEANARVAELERNVADLQKMLELKQQGVAPAPAVAAPAVAAPPPAEKPAEAPAKAPEAAPVVAPAPAPAAAPAAPPAVVADEPVKPRPKASPAPAPVAEPSLLEDLLANPATLGGAAGLIALVGGWFAYRRRKSAQAAEEGLPLAVNTLSPSSLGANSVFRATGGQSVDTSNVTPATTDFSQAGPGVIDTDEVDPVAEAEVYMAYGRDAQAEEILVEALAKDNKRTSIHLKLLEIYAARKSLKQFETLAGELYAVTGGAGPEWEKAAAMGLQLDAGNPVYSRGPSAVATPAAESLREPSLAPDLAPPPADDSEPGLGAADSPPEAAPAADAGAFDFDLGIQALSGTAEPAASGSGYRFDFDFGENKADKTAATPAAGDDLAPAPEAPSGEHESAQPVLDAAAPAAPAIDDVIALGDGAAEGLPAFDFDLGEALAPMAAPTATEIPADLDAPPVAGDPALDLPGETDVAGESLAAPPASDFSLDFPESDTLTMPPEPAVPQMADEPPAAAAEMTEAAAAPEAAVVDDIALDFDLGLDDVGDAAATSALPALDIALSDAPSEADAPRVDDAADSSGAPAPSEPEMPKLNLAGISLDLDEPPPEPMAVPAAEYDGEATLFEPLAEEEATIALPEPVAEVADAFDLEAIAPVADAATAPATGEGLVADDPRWQEVGTKLDLAQAYEEMGDAEGARELLDEVLAEGNPAQQASAREMLARLG